MAHEKRAGPLVTIGARCTACSFCHSEYYSIEDGNDIDSGHSVSCTHPDIGGHRRIGDTTWDTPSWCPMLKLAIKGACLQQLGPQT
jgi:hypothetical protein